MGREPARGNGGGIARPAETVLARLPLLNRNLEAFVSALTGRRVAVHVEGEDAVLLHVSRRPEERLRMSLPPHLLAAAPGTLPPPELQLLTLRGLGRLLYESREPDLAGTARAAWRLLADAGVEGLLTRDLAGASRILEPALAEAESCARGEVPAGRFLPELSAVGTSRSDVRLLALLYMEARAPGATFERIPAPLAERARGLGPSLRAALAQDDPAALERWVVETLLPQLEEVLALEGGGDVAGAPPDPDAGAPAAQQQSQGGLTATGTAETRDAGPPEEVASRKPRAQASAETEGSPEDEAAGDRRAPTASSAGSPVSAARSGAAPAVTHHPLRYPRVGGGLVIDELPLVHAATVPENERSREVLREVSQVYGPPALAAFAGVTEALRRAFVVNHEKRFGGRYRTGRRVGVVNLRRFQVSRDLRLFQKLEVPDRLSYYFHLLIDVSPSMLTNRNAQKAIAIGYAFAHALVQLGLPVDVSLYSSAVTRLFDHTTDRLALFFGGSFGYLSSGTHEIEAVAYAKERADRVQETTKVIVVITDGQPNVLAARRAGTNDLAGYYRQTLVPWLRAAGIELMGLSIGQPAPYHPRSLTLSSGWDSLPVLADLLQDIVAEGRERHSRLWS